MDDAWDAAQAAAAAAEVDIRPVASLAEIDAAVEVMIATWGDFQLVPREVFVSFQESRNLVQGAWRDGRMIGFALGWWGIDDDGWHLHSHMLAVTPDLRSSGVGYALKLAQRAATLDAGVTRIRWTFDPLQSRNAYFNLYKLGAVADSFHRNHYGDMPDILNSGDRSDRLVVRWDLLPSPGSGGGWGQAEPLLLREGPSEAPKPSPTGASPEGHRSVEVPREYAELRRTDSDLADAWRDAVADAMESCFASGLIARTFTADSAYLFA
ncbi:MAG: GNAT family N-acetyltransferase [Actinomycetota bacterium]